MELSVLVARIIAVAYISVGVGMFLGKINVERMVEEFEKSSALTYLAGIVTLIVGMLLVQSHNFWVKDWTVLITIIGWIALAKGVMLTAFPEYISFFKGWYKNTQVWGIFVIALGVMFGYFGFVI